MRAYVIVDYTEKKSPATHGKHTTYTHSGAADVEEQQMVGASCFKLAVGTHGDTKRLAHTHTSGPPAHQAPSWIFMGSLSHLPQGHQATPVHSEAPSATLAPRHGSHTCITVQGANYG